MFLRFITVLSLLFSLTNISFAEEKLSKDAFNPTKAPIVKKIEPPARLPTVKEQKQTKYVFDWHYVQPGEETYPGYHWHICPQCQRAVQHGPENNGNRNAHTCPYCHVTNYTQSGKPRINVSRPVFTTIPCPTGRP